MHTHTVLKSSAIAMLIIAASAPAMAGKLGIPGEIARKNADISYHIAQQETLSSIALKFTGTAKNWPAIAKANRIANDRTIPIGSEITVPSRLLPDRSAFATVVALRGAVNMTNKAGEVVDSRIGAQVPEGAVIVTDDDGFITFQLQDGTTFALPPSSNLQLTLLRIQDYTERSRTQLTLKQGRVSSEVTPFKLPGAQYQIQTPLAIAGVRGTRFRVNAEPQQTYSEVLNGTVGVTANGKQQAARPIIASYGSVVGSDGRQSAPIPLLPAPRMDGAAVQERLPVRVQLAQPDAAAFRVTVSTDQDGLHRVAETRVPGDHGQALARFADLDDGDYVIRASAIDSIGLEGMEAVQPLHVKARPFAPLLQTPGPKVRTADGAAADIAFQWAQVGDAVRYRLQIARDPGFSDLLSDRPELASNHDQQSGLKEGLYYWRVASIADKAGKFAQGPWSDAAPLAVLPQQQAPEASQEADRMRFSWRGETGQQFVFESAATPGFEHASQHIETTESAVSFATPEAGTYYARVQSIDPDGYRGAFSPPQKYVVERRWRTGDGGSLNSGPGPVRAD
ncbi:FecR domain-containing protein [Herbaspirillum chlorophenolicum]|uniref:FecR domain-containing protein n=1 Tax=Herbaspirillum chlorophenolicum TaxID=211589 RepID=A0ABW8EVZ8_9BURK